MGSSTLHSLLETFSPIWQFHSQQDNSKRVYVTCKPLSSSPEPSPPDSCSIQGGIVSGKLVSYYFMYFSQQPLSQLPGHGGELQSLQISHLFVIWSVNLSKESDNLSQLRFESCKIPLHSTIYVIDGHDAGVRYAYLQLYHIFSPYFGFGQVMKLLCCQNTQYSQEAAATTTQKLQIMLQRNYYSWLLSKCTV